MPATLIDPKSSARRGPERRTDLWRAIAVCGFLVAAILLVFSQTLRQGFLNWDDTIYVCRQPHVSAGLSGSGIVWAFTQGPLGDWCPLSMLSHMLDCQLYGLNPAGHHLTNVLLHAASAVTLFLVLWRMTGSLWPSALVAALFALHPLRVESVAWIAERRDVLSGLFFMLTLGAYGEYVRHPRSVGRYLAVVGFFVLGLLAKPMLVTLPALLLLLDFWPFARFGQTRQGAPAAGARPAPFPWRVVVDKLPLLALALAAAGATMLTHGPPGGNSLTLPERLANAAVSCVAYLGQLFVPVGLSPFYAYPEAGRPAWQVAAAVALLLAITLAAVVGRRSYPYSFVGWFWYVGMLVPVLELVPVGGHARADRYTYLSQIGLYVALVWGTTRLGAAWPARRWVFGIGSALALAALMACTWRQTGFWHDDQTLWEHALACDPKNARAHYFLGTALEEKDESAAAAQYRQALQLGPNERNIYNIVRATAHNRLGNIAAQKGDYTQAFAHYLQALKLDSKGAGARINMGKVLIKQGKLDEAVAHYRRTVELEPDNADGYFMLGLALSDQGKTGEAIANLRQALAIDPNPCVTHLHLANLLVKRDEVDEALVHFRRAIEIDPDVAYPYYQIAQLLRARGKMSEAAEYEKRAKEAGHRYAELQNLRGTELVQQGKVDEAIVQFQAAIAAAPNFVQAHNNLANALVSQGKNDDAIMHYRQALAIDPNFTPAKQRLERLLNR